jgi:membrane protein DedA with SNARE-associated domain
VIPAGESAGIVDALWAFVQEYPDPVAFGLLLLCGIGLPMPEEPILLMVGAVVVKLTSGGHAGGIGIQLLRMTSVCAAGILAGDVLCFHLGRKVGREIFRFRIVRAIATRPRRIRAERFFHRYGPWAIFMARFFAGVRIVMFFGAGMSHRVSYLRFVLMDFLGVLVSVPISIWIGFVVVRELSDLKDWESAGEKLGHFHLLLVAAAVAGIAVWFVLARKRRAADREEQRTGVVD